MSQVVLLEIKTIINHVDGTLEENIYNAQGNLYQKNQDLYLRYKEHSDLGNTWSIIKWSSEDEKSVRVTVLRQGDIKTNQIFEEGFIHKTLYHSLHGTLEMEIKTTKVTVSMKELEEGAIYLKYALKVNGQLIGDYILSIKVGLLSNS